MTAARRLSLAGLVLLMAGSGVLHLRKPEIYLPIVPRFLGNAEFYVFWSGILELAAAAFLVLPRTRRPAAMLTAAILIGVFPANVQMALDGGQPGGGWYTGSTVGLWLRLPLQPLLIWWAWTFARTGKAEPVQKGV
ncbi:MAG TPA: hypothetical protein VHJ78_05280 [Actinomycetota bacterium]|nr:hypothetical protein [Actinomycetota bacterium]